MTAHERRAAVAAKYGTLIGRNLYSQPLRDYCFRKYKDGNYYSDCSSSISLTYDEVGEGFGNLNTAVPVILGYSLVAFYDISFSINTTILSPREEFVASAFALHDTVADGTLRSKRSWLIIVVDEVAHG